MTAAAFLLSLYLRLGNQIWTWPREAIVGYALGFSVIAAGVFWASGLHRAVWRYFSMPDVVVLLRAVTLVVAIAAPVFFIATRLEGMPRSTFVIDWFVMLALLSGPRFAYRAIKDRGLRFVREGRRRGIPVLVVGAGDSADAFIREMARDPLASYAVVGLVADKPGRVGREIASVPVLGTIDDLADVIAGLDERGLRPQRLIIAAPMVGGSAVRRLLDVSDRQAIPLARLPRITDFQQAKGELGKTIEPVAIEDLLGRSQVVLDRPSMQALIAGRRVLVTGAGGTIGGELSRQIAALGPARLALIDSGEYQLYRIDGAIAEAFPELSSCALIADVRDRGRLAEVMAQEHPHLVFHAAALKHVPIVEANAVEGVLTNVVGTRNVADCCAASGVDTMVLISTDKAVNPANVMGASKRVAEMIAQSRDVSRREGRGTRFVTVRFGNVLGSTGSVVPLFQRQLAQGGPLTVTDPEVTRYFMTVREAVELVLQAAALASEEPSGGKLFVLDMGEPVRIVDLARQMIRLAGRKPDAEVPIVYVGLRPGEKRHEELFYPDERPAPTRIASIRLAAPRPFDEAELGRTLDEIEEMARARRGDRVLSLLNRLIPEFAAQAHPSRDEGAPRQEERAISR